MGPVPGYAAANWFPFTPPFTHQPFGCVYRSWNRARTLAGMPELRVHDLRHSFASFLVNAGCSLYEVQKILGHASITMTQRYSHLSLDSLLKAVSHAERFVVQPPGDRAASVGLTIIAPGATL